MFTKRQMAGTLMTVVLFYAGPAVFVKLWAARHSTHDGIDGTIGSAVQAVL